MINSGVDNGSTLSSSFRLLDNHGAATQVELPYVAGNYRAWDLNSSHWSVATRAQLGVSFGTSSTMSTAMSASWNPEALVYKGGPYAFDGSLVAVDGTFCFDLSQLITSSTAGLRYYLRLGDSTNDGSPLTISDFRLVDVARGKEIAAGGSFPLTINGSTSMSYIDYDISTGGVPVVDAQSPTVPQNIVATKISSSTTTIKVRGKTKIATSLAIDVSWSASSDNVGVTQYLIFRNGVQIGQTAASGTLVFTDKSTVTTTGSYTYTVKAQDAAGNLSDAISGAWVGYSQGVEK